MQTLTGIPAIDALLADADETTNRHGNLCRHVFLPANRYLFDVNLDSTKWAQFDTESDASYFGIWVNKTEHRTACYAEGDSYVVQCVDAEHYDSELADLCDHHPPAPALTTIADGKITRIYEDRREHFVDPENCPPSQIQFDEDGNQAD